MLLLNPIRLKKLAALISLALVLSLVPIEPVNAKSRSKSRSSASAKRSKSKARAARSRGKKVSKARGKKVRSRYARRSRVRGKYARGRGRRGRWQRRVVTANGTGVHKFLTNSWTEAQAPVVRTTPSLTSEGTGNPPRASAAGGELAPPPPVMAGSTAISDATTQGQPGESPSDAPPLNPLVAAYADSLALRGFDAENQGFIVATLKGEVLAEHNADRLFNPASVTKVATSLTAISRLGPDFRFRTSLYTDGAFDPSTGILHGSLYVIGSGDPAFFYENGLMIVDKLNQSGIREVDGNLFVLGRFYYNFSASPDASAKSLRATFSPDSWNATVKNAYPRFLAMKAAEARNSGHVPTRSSSTWSAGPPSLKVTGKTIVEPGVNTGSLKLLAVHTSLPLVRLLKGLNDFSNNWMAMVIGNLVGGPEAVMRFLQIEVGFKEEEVSFATSSGLGANQISPRGTMIMLRKLIGYLETKGLGLEDVLPIAGIDGGTLERRFTEVYRGSVVAKTGTLSGVSALAGVAHTRLRGPVLFVIYNRGGSAARFRAAQDETIKKLITLFGGPVPLRYSPTGAPRISDRATEAGTRQSSTR
ncbi:MAG TPA: D-alanyl-D-alanine carboxypeptidase [Blastocatellia bacterium]|nr:D-alanyl-D-alanine carboxypeptidase [Blastocatellia bacterium]